MLSADFVIGGDGGGDGAHAISVTPEMVSSKNFEKKFQTYII